MKKIFIVIICALILSSCIFQSPAEQCLNSFRDNLKDPESGRVISLLDSVLTYTATNSYGARLKGKALCIESNGKWVRDSGKELEMIDNLFIEKMHIYAGRLEKLNNCRRGGKMRSQCEEELFGGAIPNEDANQAIDRLRKESINELGFN